MLSTQQVLQSLIDMQANAQQALPVIPNNGNPRGANNMPRNTGIVPPHMRQAQGGGGYDSSGINPGAGAPRTPGQISPMAERYPWLKQSASMDNIRSYLNSRRGMFQQGQQQTPAQPQRPVLAGRMVERPPMIEDPINLPVIPARAMGM